MTVVETEIDVYMVIGIKIKEVSMVITIYEGYDKGYCWLSITSGNSDCREAWRKKYGGDVRVHCKNLFTVMLEMSSWANNEMCEECVFDVG